MRYKVCIRYKGTLNLETLYSVPVPTQNSFFMHQLWHPLEVMADLGQGGFWAALPLAQLVKEPTTDPVAVFF